MELQFVNMILIVVILFSVAKFANLFENYDENRRIGTFLYVNSEQVKDKLKGKMYIYGYLILISICIGLVVNLSK